MRIFRKTVETEMTERIMSAKADTEKISQLPCPKCDQTKLQAVSVERGKTGWETRFFCGSCKTNGIINHTGFHVENGSGENK